MEGMKRVKGSNICLQKETGLGGEYMMQYIDDVSWNCTPETYKMLLTNVTPINLC